MLSRRRLKHPKPKYRCLFDPKEQHEVKHQLEAEELQEEQPEVEADERSRNEICTLKNKNQKLYNVSIYYLSHLCYRVIRMWIKCSNSMCSWFQDKK